MKSKSILLLILTINVSICSSKYEKEPINRFQDWDKCFAIITKITEEVGKIVDDITKRDFGDIIAKIGLIVQQTYEVI